MQERQNDRIRASSVNYSLTHLYLPSLSLSLSVTNLVTFSLAHSFLPASLSLSLSRTHFLPLLIPWQKGYERGLRSESRPLGKVEGRGREGRGWKGHLMRSFLGSRTKMASSEGRFHLLSLNFPTLSLSLSLFISSISNLPFSRLYAFFPFLFYFFQTLSLDFSFTHFSFFVLVSFFNLVFRVIPCNGGEHFVTFMDCF